jgi:hypothetical protein
VPTWPALGYVIGTPLARAPRRRQRDMQKDRTARDHGSRDHHDTVTSLLLIV